MSYYFKRKYNFTDHALIRAKDRLHLNHLSDIEAINYCLSLINLSYDIFETKTSEYIKVNGKELYFIINKNNNLILTLSPIKPDKLLTILENNL